MLLHYTNHSRRKAYRVAAKDMLIDLMRRLFSAVEDDDTMWTRLRFGDGRTSETDKAIGHANSFHENISKNSSPYEAVANSLMNEFTNRKKCQRLLAYFVHNVHILASRMNEIILNGHVGQANSILQCMQSVKRSIELDKKFEQNAIQASGMNKKRKNEDASQPGESAKAKASASDIQAMRRVKRSMGLDAQFEQAAMRETRITREQNERKPRGREDRQKRGPVPGI